MKFLVDAQLPPSLASLLRSCGHDTTHTLELPEKNRTTDGALCRMASSEQCILVTKDEDFVDPFLLKDTPPKLLLVATGNITTRELLALLQGNLPAIVGTLSSHPLSKSIEVA